MRAKEHEALSDGRVVLAKMMTAHWFVEHGKQIAYASVTIAALLIFLFSWSRRSTGERSDYLKAEAAFSTWAAQEKHDLALFKQVNEPIERHPELAAKFGTLIAQRLLALGEAKLAQGFAQAALKRTKALLSPYHSLFSENTLLISEGRLQEALSSAHQLKAQMADDEALWKEEGQSFKTGRALYAYNLLRIASLEREAGSIEGEMTAWQEMMQSAGWTKERGISRRCDPAAFKALSENFQSGDVTLVDFIRQRMKDLNLLIPSCAAH